MTDLRASELRSVREFAERTLLVDDFAHVPDTLRALAGVVGSDAATLTHLDLRSQREVALFWPASRGNPGEVAAYARMSAMHPLRRALRDAVARGRAGPPLRLSDAVSRSRWRASTIRRAAMTDVDDQLVLVLAARASAVHAVTLSRADGVFTERERSILGACARHMSACVARARRKNHYALQIAPDPQWVPAAAAPGLATPPAPGLATVAAPGLATVAVRPSPALSPREVEVLDLVSSGLTDAQIATRLGLRPATVSKHLTRVYTRLQVPNRAAAVRALAEIGAAGPESRQGSPRGAAVPLL
jgi:DNA-binding CsgD family transcriptional regulator